MGILALISPRWAYMRQQWKEALRLQKRSYDAGRFENQNRNWLAVNQSAEATDKDYRSTVRARSRDLERNSDLMNAQIHPFVRNVVGQGFELEAQTPDEAFNAEIEKLWVKWCKKDNCDITGSQSLWEMARMAVRRKRIDGGILFVKCFVNEGIVPFMLQALEVDELDDLQYAPHTAENKVVGGIEYNSYKRAVGYWFREYDLEGNTAMTSRYVPRENVIFYYSKNRPSQIREMPEMAATLNRIKEVNGFIEAATIKERMAACLGLIIKKVLPTGTLGRATTRQTTTDINYNNISLQPGMITQLNAGDDASVVNPGNSATNSSDYIKTMSRIISAGQGISYEAASRDLSQANYSSARQATIEDEETFLPEQQKLKDEFLDDVYETFVISAVMSGAVECPHFWDKGNKDIYTAHDWNKKPKKWIDPLKEANGNKVAIETGQKTVCDIWRENGRDYKEVLDEMKKVQDYAQKIGLTSNIFYLGGGEQNAKQAEQ